MATQQEPAFRLTPVGIEIGREPTPEERRLVRDIVVGISAVKRAVNLQQKGKARKRAKGGVN